MREELFQIRRERLADQVADKIMQMIRNGDFKPGDKLPSEPELMKIFNVGRSSIREAIGALSLIGLVTVRPGQGTHVAGQSLNSEDKPIGLMLTAGPDKVREFVEARLELEKIIARLAAERATDQEIEALKAIHARLKPPLKNRAATIEADLEFHGTIARASHNSLLVRILSELRLPMRNWIEQKADFKLIYGKVYEQHAAIMDAIEARDGSKAQAAMQAHLESIGEKLVAAIQNLKTN